jgi:hypothetical protein
MSLPSKRIRWLFIRTIGIARVTTKIGIANLVYKNRHLIFPRDLAITVSSGVACPSGLRSIAPATLTAAMVACRNRATFSATWTDRIQAASIPSIGLPHRSPFII